MAHSFFKFDFGRDGMPGNMGQANWQRLAKYMKKAQPENDLHTKIGDKILEFKEMLQIVDEITKDGHFSDDIEESIVDARELIQLAKMHGGMDEIATELDNAVEEFIIAYDAKLTEISDSQENRQARVAHRVWDIVSNDGIPTAHRKVDEMTVINRDHKRLADTSELDVGDQVVVFTDGVQVQARIASIQNDGNLVLNVNGSLVSNVDPGFVFLEE